MFRFLSGPVAFGLGKWETGDVVLRALCIAASGSGLAFLNKLSVVSFDDHLNMNVFVNLMTLVSEPAGQ